MARCQCRHVSLDQLKVMSAIEACRTARLGGYVVRCDACRHTQIQYCSCRNRHCPKCQGSAARDWLADREADLLPVPYHHVVFTLPVAIARIAWQSKAVVYDIVFKAAAETTLTIAADPKHLGARVGIAAVLHTRAFRRSGHRFAAPKARYRKWIARQGVLSGSAMTHHPHIHRIVPGGGISLDGSRWISRRPDFFLPVRVLSALFRRLMLQKLAAAHAAGRLTFHGGQAGLGERRAFMRHLNPLRRKRWFVYSKPPFAGPKAVLAYLARYTRRIAISNRRLIRADAGSVTSRSRTTGSRDQADTPP
jgi:hypothetical protein